MSLPAPISTPISSSTPSTIYKGKSGVWHPWQKAVAQGVVAHHCDNSFAYGLLIKSGVGIGLPATYALADTALIPLDLDVHIALRIHLLAMSERPNVRSWILLIRFR